MMRKRKEGKIAAQSANGTRKCTPGKIKKSKSKQMNKATATTTKEKDVNYMMIPLLKKKEKERYFNKEESRDLPRPERELFRKMNNFEDT